MARSSRAGDVGFVPSRVDGLGGLEVGVMGATAADRAQGAVGARFYSRVGLAGSAWSA